MTSVKLLIWMTAFCAAAATTNVTTTNVTTPKTVLVVKEVHTYDGSKTVSRQGSFMALLEYNKAFIDKTLLIKEVLEQEEKVVLINRPRRWGKTANLGMIGTFLEMQLDNHHRIIQPKEEASNYRLFKKGELMFRKGKIDKLREPLLISRYQQYMDEYQGQYPVIEVNFEAWLSGTYIGMEKTMRHRMSDIFFEFKYMKDILEKVIDGDEASNKQKIQAKKSLDHFKLIQKSKGSVEETKTALIFLSELLHWHFKKPVVILVNEYDTPLINVVNDRGITTEDKYRFIDYYQDFIWKTFKQNSFLKKGILTGILRIFKADVLYSAQYKHKYAYVDDPFFEFYGFTDVEAEWLLDYYNISQQARAEVRDWCCGYHAYGIASPSVCLPLSFVRYILSGQLANYWVETGNEVGNVKGFVDIPVFREALLLLVYGNEFIINLEDLHFNIDDYMEFQRYVNVTEVPEANATHFVSLAFRYLWGHGYLTYSHRTGPKLLDMFNLTDSNPNVTQVRLKFPNREISKYLGSYIVEYYEDKLDIDYISSFNMNNLRNEFKKFVTSEDHRSYKLEEFFEDFFTLLSSALDKVIFVEEYAPGLLNYLALLVDGVQKLGFQEKPYIGRPDMILHLPDRVVVIEYVLDGKTGQGALKRALQYENLIKQSGITNRIKFIGISVTMLKKVSIYAQVKKV